MNLLIVLTLLVWVSFAAFDITDYGAVPHSDSVSAQFRNQKAILDAFRAANASSTDRVVRIPSKTYYSMPIRIQNAHNVSILILGKLSASKNVRYWPRQPQIPTYYEDFISFRNCVGMQISGGGKIDGRGYHWWMLLFLNDKKYLPDQNSRPHLIHMLNCNFTRIHDIIMKNSAQFHVKMDNCHDAQFFNINIRVNITAQLNLIKRFSLQGSIIMFPFNTDGIDPSGARMHFYNLTVQNYDDVVVPKPQHEIDCTRDMLIENSTVYLGVGMTVGSVPPELTGNCVRNITFRNVEMIRPLKGIYVKSNPGDQGYGIVQDILYYNFTMDRPIWWAIYIGPQQMKEPDGDGPGCMLYPFDKKGTCATQPRVTFRNITLQKISIHKSFLYPYTIRCNISNPCTQINFYEVTTDQWQIGQKDKGYVCQFVTGKSRNNKPKLHCLDQVDQHGNYINEDLTPVKKTHHLPQKKSLFAHSEEFFRRLTNGFEVSMRIFKEIEKATHEIGYFEEDDEFDYELNDEILAQYELSSIE